MGNQFKFYKDHARACDPKDYWGQVMRIAKGRTVGEDQIQMIVDSILTGLQIGPDDVLLDLCCGNGALTDRIFAHCRGGLGVDFSPPLIEVAKRDFERPGERDYVRYDAVSFAKQAEGGDRFTKAVCYAAFQCLAPDQAERLLALLWKRFPRVERLMLGNLPDKAKARQFLGRLYSPGIEDDHSNSIGMWRTAEEFEALAKRTGWACSISRQPPEFFAASYRYDAVLTRL